MYPEIPDEYKKNRKNPLFGDSLDVRKFDFNGTRNIHIFPEDHNKMQKDIGWSLLVDAYGGNVDSKTYITNAFQEIKISEFLQETKIDTILDSLKNVSSGWESAMKVMDEIQKGNQGLKAKYIGRVVTSKEFIAAITNLNTCDHIDVDAVLKMTYALQCRLMRKYLTAQYILPYTSNQLYVSNGNDGWPNIESGVSQLTNTHSILGKIINFIGSQIRITTEPVWSGTSQGSQTSINIKVNLFNDTLEKAVDNFTFINNLIPNNMFLQYGILQAPPAYYELRIEGNRVFPLCSGNFSCIGKGLQRRVWPITLERFQYGTDTFMKLFKDGSHDFIVPDVYELDLTFKPLLPDTFNNFLYYMMSQESVMITQQEPMYSSGNLKKETKTLTDNLKEITDKTYNSKVNAIKDDYDIIKINQKQDAKKMIDAVKKGFNVVTKLLG